MSVLLEPLRALLNMITSLINGLIVGSLHFILNLLDGWTMWICCWTIRWTPSKTSSRRS